MNRRGTGTIFCIIAAILFLGRYITAAIFGSNVSSWDKELFSNLLDYTGTPLLILSLISLLIGIVYLVWAEISEKKK